MKTIILFLSLVLSASAATLYPVLTDNSGRTFSGGATNLALLNATNQTFTGANTFNTNTILGTNIVGDFLSEGSRWRRLAWIPATNYTPVSMTAATNVAWSITLPALMSTRSLLEFRSQTWKTNVTSQPNWTLEVRANATNGPTVAGGFALTSGNYMGGAGALFGGGLPLIIFRNCDSFSRQFVQGTNYAVTSPGYNLGWDTTQTTNVLHFMIINTSASGDAPINFEYGELVERY